MRRLKIFFRLKWEEIKDGFPYLVLCFIAGLIIGVGLCTLDYYSIIDLYAVEPILDIVLLVSSAIIAIFIIFWLVCNWIKAGKQSREIL